MGDGGHISKDGFVTWVAHAFVNTKMETVIKRTKTESVKAFAIVLIKVKR